MKENINVKGRPLLGSTMAFAQDTLGFTKMITEEYNGIAKARIAFRDFYFVTSTDGIFTVLQQEHKSFKKSFAYDGLRAFLGGGLLTEEGDRWKNNRRAMQPQFTKRNYESWVSIMYERFSAHMKEWKPDQTLPVLEDARLVTADVVLAVLFNDKADHIGSIGPIIDDLRQYANDKMKNPFSLPLAFPTKQNSSFKKNLKKLDDIVLPIIHNRIKEGGEHGDLLETLIQVFYDEQHPESITQIRDELVTLYIAGQETTASTIAFAHRMLDQHPDIRTALESEVSALSDVSVESLHGLKQLSNFIKETLRMFPPAWAVSREATEQVSVEGVDIKKGATVFVPIYALHHNAEFWPAPEVFNPDRFNEDRDISKHYIPFGIGPRMCIGNHFAQLELILYFVNYFQRVEKASLNEAHPFKLITPMTMGPKHEFHLTIEALRN